MGDFEHVEILRRHESEFVEVIGQEPHPCFPVSSTGRIKQHYRNHPRLAGLHESQYFECLVHGSKTTGKQRKGMRFLHEVQLSSEKIVEVDQLRIAIDHD